MALETLNINELVCLSLVSFFPMKRMFTGKIQNSLPIGRKQNLDILAKNDLLDIAPDMKGLREMLTFLFLMKHSWPNNLQ